MKANNGPILTYELVWVLFPRTVWELGADGYHYPSGFARGVLVKSESCGRAMYHRPDEMLVWKCKLSAEQRVTAVPQG